MRIITALIVILFMFSGCSDISKIYNPRGNEIMEDIYIGEIEKFNTEWDQVEFPVKFSEDVLKEIKPIGSNQDAVEIGTKIIEAHQREGKLPEYTLVAVIHSTEDNMWRFEYSIDRRNVDDDILILCGCLYTVIDGNKGTLIKAWVEE